MSPPPSRLFPKSLSLHTILHLCLLIYVQPQIFSEFIKNNPISFKIIPELLIKIFFLIKILLLVSLVNLTVFGKTLGKTVSHSQPANPEGPGDDYIFNLSSTYHVPGTIL